MNRRQKFRIRLSLWFRCNEIVAARKGGGGMNVWICQRHRFHPGPHEPSSVFGVPPRGGLP